MGKVIYSMGVSLDGFIAGPGGEIAVVPDEELHRFHNEQAREVGVHLYGRRLYQVMSVWETYAEENPSAPEHELEFARIWKATPKVVFSRTLEKVEGNATLAKGDAAETVADLKSSGSKGTWPSAGPIWPPRSSSSVSSTSTSPSSIRSSPAGAPRSSRRWTNA